MREAPHQDPSYRIYNEMFEKHLSDLPPPNTRVPS